MADNVAVTEGSGKVIATTDIGGEQFQNIIVADGTGAAVDWAAAVPVTQSGTWTIAGLSGTVSLPTGAATEASLVKIPLAQGSTTSGQSGALIQGAVTTAAPTYTTAQTSPLSLTTGGALRTEPVSIVGSKAPGTAAASAALVGAVYTAAGITLTNGQQSAIQADDHGNIRIMIAQPGSATGFVQASGMGDGQTFGNAGIFTNSFGNIAATGSTAALVRTVTYANNTAGLGVQSIGLPLWSATDLTQVRVNNAAASGDLTVVSATASQTTRVYRIRLSSASAVVVQVKDGSTVLEVINLAANTSFTLPLSDRPYWKTTAATAFILNVGSAVQVDGMVEYVKSA